MMLLIFGVLAIRTLFGEKAVYFAHLKKIGLLWYCLSLRVLYIFQIKVLCQIFVLEILYPCLWLDLSFCRQCLFTPSVSVLVA